MKLEDAEVIYSIYFAFAETAYGKRLAQKIRYERYNLAHLSDQKWIALLGVDVNNLWHMLSTYSLAQKFIEDTRRLQPHYFTDDEAILLLVAAVIHDQGESIVGDVSFSEKDSDHETKEQQAFIAHADAFSPGLSVEIKERIVKARDEIIFNPATKLGKAFNVIERIGYVRTALRASEHLGNSTSELVVSGLRWLIADVLGNQILPLLTYAEQYAVAKDYLLSEKRAILEFFNGVHEDDFKSYGPDAPSRKEQFNKARMQWKHWLQNQPRQS